MPLFRRFFHPASAGFRMTVQKKIPPLLLCPRSGWQIGENDISMKGRANYRVGLGVSMGNNGKQYHFPSEATRCAWSFLCQPLPHQVPLTARYGHRLQHFPNLKPIALGIARYILHPVQIYNVRTVTSNQG